MRMFSLSKWMLVMGLSLSFMSAGCAKHHHGMPERYGPGSMDRIVPEVNQLVDQHVKDPGKAKEVQALVKDIVDEVKRSSQQSRGYHEQLTTLNADYKASPEQFMKVLDDMNNARMASASKILGLRFKIKELLTAEEWKNLSDGMAEARSRYSYSKKGESR